MSTKVIGPIVKSTDAKDCPTGWCDPKFPAPKDWGNPTDKKSGAPKAPANR